MLTVLCLFLDDFPLLLAVDLTERGPARWRWGVGGVYLPARAGEA